MWTLAGGAQQFSQGVSFMISIKHGRLIIFSRKYKHLMKGCDKVGLHWNHLGGKNLHSTLQGRLYCLESTQDGGSPFANLAFHCSTQGWKI